MVRAISFSEISMRVTTRFHRNSARRAKACSRCSCESLPPRTDFAAGGLRMPLRQVASWAASPGARVFAFLAAADGSPPGRGQQELMNGPVRQRVGIAAEPEG